MSNFCTKCGAALPEETKFCTACGTPLGHADQPAASSSQPLAGPKTGKALKVVLIAFGVFVALGVLGGAAAMFGLWKLSRVVKVDSSGQVTVSTSEGKLSLGGKEAVSEKDLGVPLYPGAKRSEGGLQISTAEGSMASYAFETADSPAQVITFYRGKLDPKATFVETPEGGMITSDQGKDEGFLITVGREEDAGKTVITISRGHSKKAR
jgi:zinc-ribbon domain